MLAPEKKGSVIAGTTKITFLVYNEIKRLCILWNELHLIMKDRVSSVYLQNASYMNPKFTSSHKLKTSLELVCSMDLGQS